MRIRITLTGTSPLLMHNPIMADPEHPIIRELKALTGKRKKTEEDFRMIKKLEWFGGLYEEDGVIVQPSSKVRKCLINTARMSKLGKAVERSLSFSALNVPLSYDGPRKPDQVWEDAKFHSYLSVVVGQKRVMRMRPKFSKWALDVDGLFVEDAGLSFDELERLVELAGIVEGIGDNRVNGYGRFAGKVVPS